MTGWDLIPSRDKDFSVTTALVVAAKIKNILSNISTSPYTCMMWC